MLGAIGRSLIAAAAISLCAVAAFQPAMATGTQPSAGKPLDLIHAGKRHTGKKSAHLRQTDRKSAKAGTNKNDEKPAKLANETGGDHTPAANLSSLPPAIANARAEVTSGDVQANNQPVAVTEPDKTAEIETASNGVQIAAADQLNDIDRDMIAETPAPTTAPVQMAALPQNQNVIVQTVSRRDDVLDKTALIGKIMIGLGAMLTLTAAARMIIA